MFHALSGAKRAAACRLLHRNLRPGEFLAPRSEEVSDVVNGIVLGTSISAVTWLGMPRLSAGMRWHALVFILIAVMALAKIGALIGRGLSCSRRRAELFQQLWRHFLQKS